MVSRKAAIYPVMLEARMKELAAPSCGGKHIHRQQGGSMPSAGRTQRARRWRINFNFAEGQLSIGDKSMGDDVVGNSTSSAPRMRGRTLHAGVGDTRIEAPEAETDP